MHRHLPIYVVVAVTLPLSLLSFVVVMATVLVFETTVDVDVDKALDVVYPSFVLSPGALFPTSKFISVVMRDCDRRSDYKIFSRVA